MDLLGGDVGGVAGQSVASMQMRPMLFPVYSVNQNAPSRPDTMPWGPEMAVGMGYSVMLPFGKMRPIWFALNSANHIAPSGPHVMPRGVEPRVGMGYSVMLPLGNSK